MTGKSLEETKPQKQSTREDLAPGKGGQGCPGIPPLAAPQPRPQIPGGEARARAEGPGWATGSRSRPGLGQCGRGQGPGQRSV